ncbi:hypothetical protein [Halobaculum gomorrense]|uniref:DUF8009 domain-containing protein n=1 Tax=Halobaculum gomorrense TaxID=43928 RepID=A0A1M5V4F6_9EURY|nr:hypothetical protein [Halobaculum gomorrense]SHH70060.1 hypothetical protein SAMN05443636_3234 [Halobaculum gomorrense]
MPGSDDSGPSVIRQLSVTTDDILAALEARDRGRRKAVLRITPPFSGRMRARLHVAGAEGAYDGGADAEPIHVEPRAFLPDDFPRFPGTGPQRWCSAVRDSLQERVELSGSDGPLTVRVRYLD